MIILLKKLQQKKELNTGIELLAVVKAKKGKVEDVKLALEKVKDDKKEAAFYPGEGEAVDNAEIKTVDNYVGLFIIPDYDQSGENNSEKAAEIFEKALRQWYSAVLFFYSDFCHQHL